MQEETGYVATEIIQRTKFYALPGISDEEMIVYSAHGLTAGEPRRETGEDIENVVVPWKDAMDWIRDGKIHDAKTIVGLLYCDALRQTNAL